MLEVWIVVGFLVVAVIVGSFLKPDEDQLRPLTPQASSGSDDGHGQHH
jgi:hypothetical protein